MHKEWGDSRDARNKSALTFHAPFTYEILNLNRPAKHLPHLSCKKSSTTTTAAAFRDLKNYASFKIDSIKSSNVLLLNMYITRNIKAWKSKVKTCHILHFCVSFLSRLSRYLEKRQMFSKFNEFTEKKV